MVAALIPAAIVGIILLAIGSRFLASSSALFPDRAEQRRRDEKGAAGNTLDFIAGEGSTEALREQVAQKGIAGAVADTVAGQGAAAGAGQALRDGYVNFQIAAHNAITDPFNLRGIPDLTFGDIERLRAAGYNPDRLTAQEAHDIVLSGALDGGADAQAPAQQQSGGVAPVVIVSPQPHRGVAGVGA